MADEVGLAHGAPDGGGGQLGGTRRGRQWRRRARCEEELSVGAVRSTTHEGCWRGGGGSRCSSPRVGRGLTVVEHRIVNHGLAGRERRVKT